MMSPPPSTLRDHLPIFALIYNALSPQTTSRERAGGGRGGGGAGGGAGRTSLFFSYARCMRSVASLTPRTRHRIVSLPSFLIAANLWHPEKPKYLPDPGGHSSTSMGSLCPLSAIDAARASTLSSSSAREPASGLLMALRGRSRMRALRGAEARSALLASSDQPKAASAACAVVQVRGSRRFPSVAGVSSRSEPSLASPPPRAGLSWPLFGPSLLGGVRKGLEKRDRLNPPSEEGEGRGRRRGASACLIVRLVSKRKKKVSLPHNFVSFQNERATNLSFSMPFEKNREANSLAELSRRLREQQQAGVSSGAAGGAGAGGGGRGGGASDAKSERLAAGRKRPPSPAPPPRPLRTLPLPPPPVFEPEKKKIQTVARKAKSLHPPRTKAKKEPEEPSGEKEEEATAAAAAAAAAAVAAAAASAAAEARVDSYAAAFSRDLEACAAAAAPVSVLGQAIGVLVGEGWSGSVWDEV